MSVDCRHGSFSIGLCPDCRMDRIEVLLERIATALENEAEGDAYARALDAWSKGQGRHPDDA